jgi:micrococcal nuclease
MARYQRSVAAQLFGVAILALLVLARWRGWLPEQAPDPRRGTPTAGLAPGWYDVERVVDGDTLLLSAHGRLRLQGVDCPEMPHDGHPDTDAWAPEAVAFTQRFVRDARHHVRIEVDGEGADHYGRWLAFVWDGQRMLNEELVRAGLARAKLRYDYSQAKKDRLRAAEIEAQRAGRGMWAVGE